MAQQLPHFVAFECTVKNDRFHETVKSYLSDKRRIALLRKGNLSLYSISAHTVQSYLKVELFPVRAHERYLDQLHEFPRLEKRFTLHMNYLHAKI